MIDAGDSVKGQLAHEHSISYRLRKQSGRCQRIEFMDEANYARDWVAVLVISYAGSSKSEIGNLIMVGGSTRILKI
jgi:hypothetical protein